MRVLTVQQPWASLIALPDDLVAKRVENRRWSTAYRGPVAIHAGKAIDQAAVRDPVVGTVMTEQGLRLDQLPAGAIIAVAELTDVHESEGDCCFPWGFSHGWQHLLLADVRPLRTPVEFTGNLGLRSLHEDQAAEVLAAL